MLTLVALVTLDNGSSVLNYHLRVETCAAVVHKQLAEEVSHNMMPTAVKCARTAPEMP